MSIISTNESAQVLSANEVLYLTPSGSITGPGIFGVAGLGQNCRAVIAGAVMGQSGIGFSHSVLASNNYIHVTASGSVDAELNGILMGDNTSFVVQNSGSIYGGHYGIFIDATGPGTDSIRNSGTITGELAAIGCDHATNPLSIRNTGLLDGGTFAINLASAVSQVSIVNFGRIEGSIATAGGNDTVVNAGNLHGDIFTGAGTDRVDLSQSLAHHLNLDLGADGDLAILGAGRETVIGGTGTDTVSYEHSLRVRVNLADPAANTGDAAGDSFSGVEVVLGSALGNDTITGADAADRLGGLGGRDRLLGGGGDDRLTGGLAADRLTGGAGEDEFRFDAIGESGDGITDFHSGTDHIALRGSGFGGGLVAGDILASQFAARADNHAQDSSDRFIFRSTDKTLWFDADGAGAGAAVLLADLQAGATMTFHDIVIL